MTAEVDAAVAQLREAARRRLPPSQDEPRGRVVCGECHGARMVEVDTSGHGAWRPCPRCRPVTHGNWLAGAYEPVNLPPADPAKTPTEERYP